MSLFKTYIKLIKNKMFSAQIWLFIITFISLLIDTKVAAVMIIFILVSNYGIDNKMYTMLNVLGIRTTEITKLNYLLYFVPIITAYGAAEILRGYEYNELLSNMFIMLITINILIPILTEKEMGEPSSAKIIILALAMLPIILFIFYFWSTSVLAIIIEVILFMLSLAVSGRVNFQRMYGRKMQNG